MLKKGDLVVAPEDALNRGALVHLVLLAMDGFAIVNCKHDTKLNYRKPDPSIHEVEKATCMQCIGA